MVPDSSDNNAINEIEITGDINEDVGGPVEEDGSSK
jgi:hypothetical protein